MTRSFLLAIVALCGCSMLHGVQVETLAVSAQKPNQVAAYLRVSADGKPLTGLGADRFFVYEDGAELERTRIEALLLDPNVAAAHHTLLLVDNGLATAKDVRQELLRAIAMFVERVRTVEPVSVYAFDGGPEIKPIAEYPRSSKAKPPDRRQITALEPADTSRNLNGAVTKAVQRLDVLLAAQQQPLKVGTLVIFAGGPDLAGRVDHASMQAALDQRQHAVIAIGIGEDAAALRELGKDGYFDAHTADTLSLAFEETAHRVRDRHEQHYLLAYCSPARAGVRQLRVEVRAPAADGAERRGDAHAEFDATGFGAGCNARQTPRFERPAKPSR